MAEAPESTETPEKPEESNQLDLFAEKIAEQNSKVAERQEQLLEELRASRREAPREPEKPAEDRIYSAAEVQKFIDDGHISQAQGMEYLAEVKAAKMIQAAEKRFAEQSRAQQSETVIKSKLKEFRDAIPELADRTSDAFKEAKAAFEELIQEGHPDSAATELAALRIVYGASPGKPRKSEVKETTGDRATVDAAGTGSGRRSAPSKSNGGSSGSGFPSWVEPHRVEYYREAIKRGLYSGPKDPNLQKELEILKARKDAAA